NGVNGSGSVTLSAVNFANAPVTLQALFPTYDLFLLTTSGSLGTAPLYLGVTRPTSPVTLAIGQSWSVPSTVSLDSLSPDSPSAQLGSLPSLTTAPLTSLDPHLAVDINEFVINPVAGAVLVVDPIARTVTAKAG